MRRKIMPPLSASHLETEARKVRSATRYSPAQSSAPFSLSRNAIGLEGAAAAPLTFRALMVGTAFNNLNLPVSKL
jgi:hypothetical protein